jgi:adenine-specific DNA-methyltransferase
LLQYKKKLENRNKAETWIHYERYALQRWWANYMDDFNRQKIVFQEIQQTASFCLDDKKFMISNTGYIIVGEKLSILLSFLNSPIINFAYKYFYSTQLGTSGVRRLYQHIIFLPIPNNLEDREYSELEIQTIYGFTDEEIKLISSSVKS